MKIVLSWNGPGKGSCVCSIIDAAHFVVVKLIYV
uniref:Uncharacterized protein n=1 Tax=Rhizophora mucronata TaxID=61149 RepID=A0A2P2R2X0_RHIMU